MFSKDCNCSSRATLAWFESTIALLATFAFTALSRSWVETEWVFNKFSSRSAVIFATCLHWLGRWLAPPSPAAAAGRVRVSRFPPAIHLLGRGPRYRHASV